MTFTRRTVLRGGGALTLAALSAPVRAAHLTVGPVSPPVPAPSLWLTRDDNSRIELRQHLTGKVTVVQLMFTSCSATCPLQGALFARLANKVRASDVQFLSISIDPENDTAPKLAAWLKRYAATSAWRAAIPRAPDVELLFDFFRGRVNGVDRHSAQAYILDRKARLAFRSSNLPPAADVLAALEQVARAS